MAKTQKKELKFEIVQRKKGLYIKVGYTGKTTRYYKYKPEVHIDSYVQYYKDTVMKPKKKGTLTQYQKSFQGKTKIPKKLLASTKGYIKRRKGSLLKKAFKPGIASTYIPDILSVGHAKWQQHKKEIFKNIVYDDQLLNIIIQDSNIAKLATRFQYDIDFKEGTKRLCSSVKFVDDPNKLKSEIAKKFFKGEDFKIEESPKIKNKLMEIGFPNNNFTGFSNGTVKSIGLKITFRKGK